MRLSLNTKSAKVAKKDAEVGTFNDGGLRPLVLFG
jgi:hypothetical protein